MCAGLKDFKYFVNNSTSIKNIRRVLMSSAMNVQRCVIDVDTNKLSLEDQASCEGGSDVTRVVYCNVLLVCICTHAYSDWNALIRVTCS